MARKRMLLMIQKEVIDMAIILTVEVLRPHATLYGVTAAEKEKR